MKDYSDPIRAVYAACVDECMAALCKHFNTKASGYSGTFAYQTAMLAKLGAVRRETADIIARHTSGMDGMVSEAVRTAMLQAVKEVEPSLVAAVKAGVVDGTDVPVSESIKTALTSYSHQAVEQLNLVNTVMLESCLNNYRALVSNTAAYEAQLDKAQEILNAQTGKVITGVSSHQQAVRQAVQQFARTGLTVFTDKAGHRWSPEAYAAMDVRTTVNNAARQAVLDRNQEYGNDLVSVPINATARPKCYPWQGKVISTANESRTVTDLHDRPVHVYAISETTYGEPDGLWGINCHHQPTPFFAGLSVLRGEVSDKEDNDELYALTQQQRRLERDVRNLKREAVMLDAAGDQEGFAAAARKVKAAQARLRDHCEQNSLPMRSDRTQVLGYNRSVSGKAKEAARPRTEPAKTPAAAPTHGKATARAAAPVQPEKFAVNDFSYRNTLKRRYDQGTATARAVYDKYIAGQDTIATADWPRDKQAQYDPVTRKISLNLAKDSTNARGAGTTWYHEHGHLVDFSSGLPSHSADFENALRKDFADYVAKIQTKHRLSSSDLVYPILSSRLRPLEYHSISDLCNAIEPRCTGCGSHGIDYWKKQHALGEEAFAHMFEASFDSKKTILMQEYFPEAFRQFQSMMEALK